MNICPSCKTMMKTTELYDVYQCPACKLTMTTDDIKNIYNYCNDCGARLGRVQHKRRRPSICYACRGTKRGNPELREIFNELQFQNSKKTPQELGEDERFEDDPRALKEIDTGRVVRIPTQISKGGIDYD